MSNYTARKLHSSRTLSLIAIAWLTIVAVALKAQTTINPRASTPRNQAISATPVKFEVVSIRPSRSGKGESYCGMTPDGYQARNLSLAITVANAYEPENLQLTDSISGLPPWAHDTMYDIVAKVAPEDVVRWQSQGTNQDEMRLALQIMLADRFKLAAHSIPASVSGFSLVVGKRAPKLKEVNPAEPLPIGGIHFRAGGARIGEVADGQTVVRFFAATMDSFAEWLTQSSMAHPVVNATGLTGKYDFSIKETGLGSAD